MYLSAKADPLLASTWAAVGHGVRRLHRLDPNGRVECKAVAPGIPDLEAQEVRDRVPSGTYSAALRPGPA